MSPRERALAFLRAHLGYPVTPWPPRLVDQLAAAFEAAIRDAQAKDSPS